MGPTVKERVHVLLRTDVLRHASNFLKLDDASVDTLAPQIRKPPWTPPPPLPSPLSLCA